MEAVPGVPLCVRSRQHAKLCAGDNAGTRYVPARSTHPRRTRVAPAHIRKHTCTLTLFLTSTHIVPDQQFGQQAAQPPHTTHMHTHTCLQPSTAGHTAAVSTTHVVADQQLGQQAAQGSQQGPAAVHDLSLAQEGEALLVSAQAGPAGWW